MFLSMKEEVAGSIASVNLGERRAKHQKMLRCKAKQAKGLRLQAKGRDR
jgi:hypothetical protein